MLLPDRQRLQSIADYCSEIEKTVLRYGNTFSVFELAVSLSIFCQQIVNSCMKRCETLQQVMQNIGNKMQHLT